MEHFRKIFNKKQQILIKYIYEKKKTEDFEF